MCLLNFILLRPFAALMCVEHDNTPTAVLDGKLSLEETSVLSVSFKDLLIYCTEQISYRLNITHSRQHLPLLIEMESEAVQS